MSLSKFEKQAREADAVSARSRSQTLHSQNSVSENHTTSTETLAPQKPQAESELPETLLGTTCVHLHQPY